MQSFLPTLVGVAAVIYIALLALQRLTQDEEEPRTVYDGVPFVTPVFGIISKDLDFHRGLSQYRTLSFTAVVATIGANLHTDHDFWVDEVDTFNHRRFLRDRSGGGRSQSVNPFAFRAFGGGTTLCPGRHFATTEMMVLTALLALRFDVHPTNVKWAAPTTHNTPAASAMLVPD
ncbi:cytochrome P450 oxidoreductase [Apiospora arundinis]